MKIFYSENHRKHNPAFELFEGGQRVPYLENADRMDQILTALRGRDWAEIVEPDDFGLAPLLAVHQADYLNFLASAWTDWLAANPETESASDKSVLLPATFALNRGTRPPKSPLGRAGYYMMDLSACIVEGTYNAALSSARCALSGAEAIASGERAAFALCRPPGHHAGRNFAAGYCFINNAAAAANQLSSKGKAAILDIDYHAGNGTQDIFYSRSDILTISIHADPDYEYPYYAGREDEKGAGAGLGYHHNFPLPTGTGDSIYLSALDKALDIIKEFSPRTLVVSAGMDIHEGDPLGKFKVTREAIGEISRRLANLHLPTLIVMEGGYNNAALGGNIVQLLNSFNP